MGAIENTAVILMIRPSSNNLTLSKCGLIESIPLKRGPTFGLLPRTFGLGPLRPRHPLWWTPSTPSPGIPWNAQWDLWLLLLLLQGPQERPPVFPHMRWENVCA